MLTALLLLAATPTADLNPAVTSRLDVAVPSVQVRLNKRSYDMRDHARVYAEADQDGYLMVLHLDPEGRLRVLFPLDPTDDNFVRGGQEYEIRGRGDRPAFTVFQSSGWGMVYAATSDDPFQFSELALNEHWDYRLPQWYVEEDGEGALTALMAQLSVSNRFNYDLVEYDVGGMVAYGGSSGVGLSLYDPYYAGHYWHDHSAFSISLGIGLSPLSYYYWPYHVGYYRPYRSYYGWYDPFYYDPFYYGPAYYRPYYYGGTYGYGRYSGRAAYYGDRRYTFKSEADRYALRPGAIQPRSRLAGNSGTRGVATRSSVSPNRRVSPTQTATTQASPARRTTTGSTVAPTRRTTTGSATTPTRRTTERAAPTSRTTSPATTRRQPTTPTRTARPVTTRRQPTTPTRTARPVTTRRQPATTPTRTTSPATTRRQPTTPTRTARPVTTRRQPTTPTRTTSPATTRRQPATTPARTTTPRTTRPAPARTPTTRPAPSRTPTRTARPPTSRTPTRTASPPSRPPTRTASPPSRPPTRSARPPTRSAPPTRRKK